MRSDVSGAPIGIANTKWRAAPIFLGDFSVYVFGDSMSITAKYDGTCQACDGEITADVDELERDDDLGWIHEDCAADQKTIKAKSPWDEIERVKP